MSHYELFLGSFRKDAGAAIIRCDFDGDTGRLTEKERLYTVRPSWLCMDPARPALYTILEANEVDGVYGGAVEAIDLSGGHMRPAGRFSIGAKGPSQLCRLNSHLFCSVYGEGGVAQFKLIKGHISPMHLFIPHAGHGPDAARQAGPHAHCAVPSPEGDRLIVCDLGLDKVFLYPVTPENGICGQPAELVCPPGCGPRHAVFTPDGKYLYVITEMAASILCWRWLGGGRTEYLGQTETLPADWKGENTAAAIRVSRDGTRLFITNRGEDSIVFFRIGQDGALAPEERIGTGAWPRDAVWSPDERWLLCACQNDNCVDVYECPAAHALPVLREELRFPAENMPCCILFREQK